MMLEISNLSKDNKKLSSEKMGVLINIFTEKLTKLHIRYYHNLVGDKIIFSEVEPARIFTSLRTNKIVLAKTDKRWTPDKTFLKSNAMTETQYKGMLDCILGGIKRLGIKCTVTLKKKDSVELWHEDLVDMAFDKPVKFPVEL